MSTHEFLVDFILFLGVTITLVPLFRSVKLSPILAYLLGGILAGPWCLELITDITSVFKLAELGIILLLFVIGLEISPRRLSALKKKIFIDGGLQMSITTIVFMYICHLFNLTIQESFVISISLSLSSTAFVLEYLKDSKQLTLSHGQMSFSILLFQDIVIIPILAFLPFLTPKLDQEMPLSFSDFTMRTLVLLTILIVGRFIVRPTIGWVKNHQPQEIFTATCLILVIGMALIVEEIGLTKPLGAFLAGIILAESDFHTEVEKVIHPIKVMLIGIFFMAFGIEFNLNFFFANWEMILILNFAYIFVKFIILMPLGKIMLGHFKSGIKLGLLMGQGGEFGIVIISGAYHLNILSHDLNIILVSLFTSSLLFAPILAKISEYVRVAHHDPDISNHEKESIKNLAKD